MHARAVSIDNGRMKRKVAVIALSVAAAISIAACGGNGEKKDGKGDNQSTATQSTATQPQTTTAELGSIEVVSFAGHTGKGDKDPPKDAVGPGESYTSCKVDFLKRLYAFVNFKNMKNGTPTKVEWSFNGEPAFNQEFDWDYGRKGETSFYLQKKGDDTLSDGQYSIKITSSGQEIARAEVGLAASYC